jgi:MoxR-like ATPase
MSIAESIEKRAALFADRYKSVYKQLGRVIVGHNEILHGVLTCLFCGGHALLEGVPGWARRCWFAPLHKRWTWSFRGSNSRPT